MQGIRLLLMAFSLLIATSVLSQAPEPMLVRYASPPGHAFLHLYKVELIQRALEVTREEFGDYQLHEFNGDNPNDQRRVLLINDGSLVNLLWAPSGSIVTKAEVIEIPGDVLQGLLGYRICLKNSNAHLSFDDISSLDDLRKIRIGQGEEWPDVNIYEANQIKPVLAPTLRSLFEMLGYKRFDCVPFGANEAAYVLQQRKNQYPFLELDDQLLLYYEFSIHFYVSKRFPRVAERLTLGLKKLQDTGEFDAMFKRYHAADLKLLDLKKRRVICLESPYVDSREQCRQPIRYPEKWLED